MSVQKQGYKDSSPYRNRKKIKINSNHITMKGVSQPILAVPDGDAPQLMNPGENYYFPNSKRVMEYRTNKRNMLPVESYLRTLSLKEQDEFMDYMDTLNEEDQVDYLSKLVEGGCMDCGGKVAKKGKWIQEAVNPKHKGYCTPITKPTCTGHRKSFALLMKKKHGFHQEGGEVYPEFDRNASNVEVENNETALFPSGELRKFKGATHANGGIPTSLPAGTKVFSEYLKVPPELVKQLIGKRVRGLSYADLSKKFPTKKYEDILVKSEDEFAINTAQVKLSTNNAALQTLFSAQEMVKQRETESKLQAGGQIKQEDTVLDQLNQFGYSPFEGNFPTYLTRKFTATDKSRTEPQINTNTPTGYQPINEDYSFPIILTEPYPTITTGVRLPPPPMTAEELSRIDYKQGPETFGEQRSYIPEKDEAVKVPPKNTTSKKVGLKKPISATLPHLLPPDPITPLPLSPVISERGAPELPENSTIENVPQEKTTKNRKKFDFALSPKLTGTLLDILLAGSDELNVVNPQYYDQRKYPLFSRFVESDDKEAERNLSLAIRQIQDSDMPEQVKQSRIADVNAQYQDYKSTRDIADAQRYQSKIEGDLNKLQSYTDRNIDQHQIDVENFLQRKARVDYLKDQFNAQRKSRIVNSARQFFDYVEDTNMKSQLSDNYRVNPWTGRVQFKGSSQDPLKKQEALINQYQQNNSSRSLPNGATFQMISDNIGIVVSADGKAEIVHLNK